MGETMKEMLEDRLGDLFPEGVPSWKEAYQRRKEASFVLRLMAPEEKGGAELLRALARWYALQAVEMYYLAGQGDEPFILRGLELAAKAAALEEAARLVEEPQLLAWR